MKKAFAVALAVVMMCFSGCGGNINENKVGKEQAEEILRCFDEEDTESLKALFCEEIKKTHDLDKEIVKAMEFYKGTSVSHDKVLISSGLAVDDGVVTDNHIEYSIKNIVTTEDKIYRVATHSYLIHQNTDYVGITYLTLIDKNNQTKCEIGELIY